MEDNSTTSTARDGAVGNTFDQFMSSGRQYARTAQWESALRCYDSAMSVCTQTPSLDVNESQRHTVLKELARVNRAMGRYDQALQQLETILKGLDVSDPLRLNITGEVGVLHRQLGHLEAARESFETQYVLATQVNELQRMCRAVGNLGMINYQLSQRDRNDELLDTAVKQLEERVVLAERFRDANAGDPTKSGKYGYANTLKAIGLSRLSLCHSARGQTQLAIAVAFEALEVARPLPDSSIEAISRFFYGRALLKAGQHAAALEQFDLPKACSPAVAFCKEPSDEHCEYLQELLGAGAEMDTPDEHGYHALDYAVFNGNQIAESIIVRSLQSNMSTDFVGKDLSVQLAKRLDEARLRKYYREIFQDQMRRILLGHADDRLLRIREAYASAIDRDDVFGKAFDRVKYVQYTDFVTFGRFPRSSDGLTRYYEPVADGAAHQHIIFISYRWVNRDPWARYPDDAENRQYRRILRAVDEYLKTHPSIDPEHLGIWIDFACIDQDEPMPGISALPLIIAQCNALISLVDEQYHGRAWCSVEVMMVQALRKAYQLHLWYEHVELDGQGQMALRVGPDDLDADPGGKKLGFESDRERVLFLERQCRLLC